MFTNKQSYSAHCGHCKTRLGHIPEDRFGDARAWAKGKTKETDDRILRMSERLKKHPPMSFLGSKHTDKSKQIMSEKARVNAKNHRNGWKAGNNKIPNKYEVFAEQFLSEKGIHFQREFIVPQSLLGKKGSYYQLDFLINGKIDLEIDGSSHSDNHDRIRDHYVGKLYQVYRIEHNDSLEQLESKLNQFLHSMTCEYSSDE